jgi:hypothetical protein
MAPIYTVSKDSFKKINKLDRRYKTPPSTVLSSPSQHCITKFKEKLKQSSHVDYTPTTDL